MKKLLGKNGKSFLITLLAILLLVLVAILVVQKIGDFSIKPKASQDLLHLDEVYDEARTLQLSGQKLSHLNDTKATDIECACFPGAELIVVHGVPNYLEVYFRLDGNYYSREYFKEVSQLGSSDVPTDEPGLSGVTNAETLVIGSSGN